MKRKLTHCVCMVSGISDGSRPPRHPASPRVTPRHPASPRVTPRHPASPRVTPRHPASPRVTPRHVSRPRTNENFQEQTKTAKPRRERGGVVRRRNLTDCVCCKSAWSRAFHMAAPHRVTRRHPASPLVTPRHVSRPQTNENFKEQRKLPKPRREREW